MRLLAAVLVCGLVCSVTVKSQEETDFVKIIAKPTIVYNVGETRAIYCNSSIDPIEWYSPQNKKIGRKSNTNRRVYVEKKSPKVGVALLINTLQISDGGNYTCRAGELSDTIDVIVGEKVNITEKFVKLEGEEGRSITMKCECKGYPAPVVVWYRENYQPIPNNSKKYNIRSDDYYNILEIRKLDHMDVGDYVCKVRQKALSYYTEKTVHLSVQHKPVLFNFDTNSRYSSFKAEEVYAILNETKNITCSAIANPLPSYRWFRTKNGFDIEEITDPDLVYHSPDGKNSTLILRMHDESDLDEYKCLASNARGKESVIFHVSLGNKPEPPDSIQLAGANSTAFSLNVTCSLCPFEMEEEISPNPENLTVTAFEFEIVPEKENYDPDWDAATKVEIPFLNPNDTLYTIGGLANDTKYHIRVRSLNAAGPSEWIRLEPDPKTTDFAFRIVASTLLIIVAYILTICY